MSTLNYSHLRLLAVYATVAESGSFAAAARLLSSSRSRVSEQVSQLEDVLGVRLLQRSTRQLLVTPEGEEVLAQASKLPALLSDVESALTPAEPQGRVAVTMNHDIAHKYILPMLEDFQREYPLISLDLILDDETKDLIAHQIDLGIRIGLPKDSSLVGRILHEEKLSIFASPKFLSENGTPKTIREIENCRWVMLPQMSSEDVLEVKGRNKTTNIKPSSFYRCNSPFMMQKMVTEGLCVGALLPSLVREEIEKGELVRLLPSLKTEAVIFSLVYPSRRQLPQRTRVLVDYLLSRASELAAAR